ncbi:hypothetical protein L596_016820 [Steinernema carpocapsae]|uniref:Serpentine receptor class gamma n=1 Tax=Steinernema carpocapsae TaxID=34508 RepID=A0A4U5NKM1_STECR|nr:hypothetical protein L596_016820 [Steinernema carpocapsae]
MSSVVQCCVLSFIQVLTANVNGLFVAEAIRVRHAGENKCHFITHSVFFCLINLCIAAYQMLVVNNPFLAYFKMLQADLNPLNVDIMWALGVGLSIAQYISFLVLVVNRMVVISFADDVYSSVWSNSVCVFLLFVQFLFPLGYVVVFLVELPRLHLAIEEGEPKIAWDNDYLEACCKSLEATILSMKKIFRRPRWEMSLGRSPG